MTQVGQAFDNPVTGERVVVLTDPLSIPTGFWPRI